ncbi:PAS domain S-box protein [candidate division WOR-3 bacterium]|uniref:PAS domain S-box protein n=1 Tax=candidate division WOR-3 bacterium TaxID=2052148 RepID=A0A937XDU2_UNCW3|nr:PAS domain S-box protein [candidate division WOR-3 bacterium]
MNPRTNPAFPFVADIAFQDGDFVFATDRFGCLVYWNKEAERISGYRAEEVLGKPYALACRIEPDATTVDLAAILGGRDFAGGVRCHSRSGGAFALYLFATAGRDPAGLPAGVVFVGRDVTGLWRAEEAAAASTNKYRALFEHSIDSVAIAEMDGRVIEANPACLRLYGYTADDVRGMKLADVVAPEDRGAGADAMEKLAAGRLVVKTIRMRRKDGSRFVADLVASVMTVGGERRIMSVTRDVTDRVRAEQARSQSERIYRTVFESANDAVFIESVDGRILDVNRNGCGLLGYRKDELLKMKVADLVPPEARTWLPHVTDAILRDRAFRSEAVNLHKDGRHIPVEISAATMELDGKTAVLVIVRDISERKRAEQGLRESEEKFRSVAEQSPNMIFINQSGRVVYTNQKSADTMGYAQEEFYSPGFDFMQLIAPESVEQIKAVYARHVRGEDVEPYEYTLLTKDGRRIESIITTKLIEYRGAKAILGIITDITERVKADRDLREEKERSQTYLALAGVMLVALDAAGSITLLNRRACEVLGVVEAEALGRNWFDNYIPERSRLRVKEAFASLMAGRIEPVERFENPVLGAGGEERLVVWHNVLLRDRQGRPTGTLSSGEDVTERERAVNALRESEEKYRSVVERASDGICVVQDGRIEYLNPRLAEIAGYAPEELVGKQFIEYLHPDDRATVVDRYRRRLAGENPPSTYRVRILTRSGEAAPVEINAALSTFEDAPADIVLVRDITERAQAEQALRESERHYRSALEAMRDPVHVADADLRIVMVNRAFALWLQQSGLDDAVLGKTVFEAFPFLPDRVREEYRRVFENGETVVTEEETAVGGRSFYTETTKTPVTEQGRVARVLTVVRDLTEQKRLVRVAEETGDVLRAVLDNSPEAIAGECENVLVYANQRFARLFGYDAPADIIGRPASDFDAPLDRERMVGYTRLREQGKDAPTSYSFHGLRRDGTLIPLEATISTYWSLGRLHVLGFIREVEAGRAGS